MDLSTPRLVDGPDEVAFVSPQFPRPTRSGSSASHVALDADRRCDVPPTLCTSRRSGSASPASSACIELAVRLSRDMSVRIWPRGSRTAFAPPLVAIAVGYHFAHFLGYFLVLAPSLAVALTPPFADPAAVPTSTCRRGSARLRSHRSSSVTGRYLGGPRAAYDIFPARLQAIRSQYPFVAVTGVLHDDQPLGRRPTGRSTPTP